MEYCLKSNLISSKQQEWQMCQKVTEICLCHTEKKLRCLSQSIIKVLCKVSNLNRSKKFNTI